MQRQTSRQRGKWLSFLWQSSWSCLQARLGTSPSASPRLTKTFRGGSCIPPRQKGRDCYKAKVTGPEMHCSRLLKTMTLSLIRLVLLLPKGFPSNQGSRTLTWTQGEEMSSLIFISRNVASIKMAQAWFTVSICGREGRMVKTHPFSPKFKPP